MKTSAICIVDDEPTIREGIALAFESSYQMEAFADTETAIKSLKHDSPDPCSGGDRHGEGIDRQRHPLPEPEFQGPFHDRQLRGHSG